MRTVLLLSVIAVLAACDDAQPTTAPANARAIPTPVADMNASGAAVSQGKPAPAPSGWTKVTVVQSTESVVLAGGATAAYASCPAGTTPISGGYVFTNEGNTAAPPSVTQSVPVADAWFVRVVDRMPGAFAAAFKSYALCAS